MPNQINLLDPLGIAATMRSQLNQMAQSANLPQLPEVPKIMALPGALLNYVPFPLGPDRKGWGRGERAG